MEEEDDGLLLNFVTGADGAAKGKRKSSKARYAEQHGKAAKKRRVQASRSGGQHEGNTHEAAVQRLLAPAAKPGGEWGGGVRSTNSHQKHAQMPSRGPDKVRNAARLSGSKQRVGPVGQVPKVAPLAGNGGGKSGHSSNQAQGEGRKWAGLEAPSPAEKHSGNQGGTVGHPPHHDTNAAAISAVDMQLSSPTPLSPEAVRSIFSASRFAELGLSPPVAQHIEGGLGFTAPTHVQKEAIPVMLTGRDALVKADTGSGKTLAYLAPIVDQLAKREKKVERTEGTHALILAPTRELCLQIYGVAEKLVKRFIWLVPGQIMGGEKKAKEKARLRKGVTILVATPGRLLDHLKSTASFRLDSLQWLIFDEADRLLDLGFEKDIVQILEILDDPSKKGATGRMRRQIALFSATLNARVDRLANLSLANPLKVGLDAPTPPAAASDPLRSQEGAPQDVHTDEFDLEEDLDKVYGREKDDEFRIPPQLRQFYVKVPWKLRLVTLCTFLRAKTAATAQRCKAVVFFSTCDAVEFHHLLLSTFSIQEASGRGAGGAEAYVSCPVFKLHGNLSQKERSQTFFAFSKAASGVLLCTDVAARGLDIPAVNVIVQYDTPGEAEEYVHRRYIEDGRYWIRAGVLLPLSTPARTRVGRTARLGQEGESFLFLQPNEVDYLDVLARRHVAVQPLALMSILEEIPLDRRKVRPKEALVPEVHPGVLALEKRLEGALGKQRELRQLATDAFRSFLRSYAAHRGSLKRIFHVKKLHLGHVARSFALRDAPSLLGQSSKKLAMKKEKQERLKKFTRKKKRVTAAIMGE